MKPGEDYIILGFFAISLSILILISFLGRKKSIYQQFLFKKKKGRIDWKKVGKIYLWVQGFILFSKIGNENMTWFLTLTFPLLIIVFLLTYYFMQSNISEEDAKVQFTDEYKSYKKTVERDNKIKDILR
jgi:protein-S-isoprenylcysteine O-methyltransferase Ste14